MKLEATCTVTVTIDCISGNSIELAAIQGAKEAGKKLFLAFLELVQKTQSKDRKCR